MDILLHYNDEIDFLIFSKHKRFHMNSIFPSKEPPFLKDRIATLWDWSLAKAQLWYVDLKRLQLKPITSAFLPHCLKGNEHVRGRSGQRALSNAALTLRSHQASGHMTASSILLPGNWWVATHRFNPVQCAPCRRRTARQITTCPLTNSVSMLIPILTEFLNTANVILTIVVKHQVVGSSGNSFLFYLFYLLLRCHASAWVEVAARQ